MDGNKIFILCLLSFTITLEIVIGTELFAQNTISGQAEIPQLDPRKTKQQFEYEAYFAAINNALESEFGSSVTNNFQALETTGLSGRSVLYHNILRNNYTSMFPNGIWIKEISKNCNEEKSSNDIWWTICTVKGIAREIETTSVNFIAQTMDGTDHRINQTDSYIEGESGYVYFKSAEDGFLLIFINDFTTVQRMLPYNGMKEVNFPVISNKDYIFFSRDNSDFDNINIVDKIEFYAESAMDFNIIYIIFSPERVNPPILDEERALEDGYSTFKSLKPFDFNSWLQKSRKKNSKIQVKTIGITIKKQF